jgi:crotonobetainyl-CoA:carnitine CoA-transferase CaiB-like acyl-CoA transferase
MDVLAGVRVVEMGLWVAGPAAGGILADWGAEVVKIEPRSGDPMRGLFGALSGSKEQRCPPFDLYNRGKRSVALDINTPEGRDLAERIIADADVFLTNMRPAFLYRVGLGHEQLLDKYPRLVYASLTGYGLDGPDRDAPGFDVAAFGARAGVSDRSTPPGQAPTTLPGGLGDAVTGLSLVAGVLAALLHRERTGRGQLVATSLMRSGAFCIGMELSTRLGLGRLAATRPRSHPQNPLLNSYVAKDGRWFWLIGAEADRHWPALIAATGDDRLADERFATARGRRRAGDDLMALLDETFAQRTRDEWGAVFAEHGVWWTPVNSVEDLLVDPQAEAAGLFVEVPTTREGADGPDRSLAAPADFGSATDTALSAPPEIGADTEDVLRGLGLDDQDLARLRKDGIASGPTRSPM